MPTSADDGALPTVGSGLLPADGLARIRPYVTAAFFAALFFLLTTPAFDTDLWWHLATGRWIWEHGAVPRADPFDFTSAIFGSAGQVVYQLTQYWLAQVLLYAAYLSTGLNGVVLLRAAVFTSLFFLLYRLLRRTGAGMLLSTLVLALGVQAIVRELALVADRPQMWSSLLFVALLSLLEELRAGKRWAPFALPPLMLLWSNLHGGYILGVIVIVIAAGAAQVLRHDERKRILLAAALSIAATGCNPAGFEALLSYPRLRISSSGGVIEEVPLFRYVRVLDLPKTMPALTALLVLPLLTLLPRLTSLRRDDWHPILIYLLTLGLGIKAQRHLVFLVPVSCWMIAVNGDGLRERFFQNRQSPFHRLLSPRAGGALTATVVFLLAASYALAALRSPRLGPSSDFHHGAAGAADFLNRSGFKGNVFNEYALGGYLAWRLNPDIKIFIYGRMVYPELLALYNDVMHKPAKTVALTPSGGLQYFYQKVFDEHAVDAVVIPAGDDRSGDVFLLATKLAWDDAWVLVDARPSALVFLRKSAVSEALVKHALPKSEVFDNIIAIARTVSRTSHGKSAPIWRRSLAIAHYGKGEKEEALRIFDEYITMAPDDDQAPRMRENLASEIAGAAR